MKTHLLPYLAFFLLSSAFALYSAQNAGHQAHKGSSKWYTLKADDLTRIEYIGESAQSTIIQVPDFKGLYWVDVKPQTNESNDSPTTQERFLAGEKIKPLISNFAPMVAKKVIGMASELKLDDFGLASSEKSLKIHQTNGKILSFLIGKKTFQETDVFVLDQEKNMVILIDGKNLGLLENPKARLAIISPFIVEKDSITTANIAIGSISKNLNRIFVDAMDSWVESDSKNKGHDAFRNWFERLFKIKIIEFAEESSAARLDAIEAKFKISLSDKKGEIGTWAMIVEETSPPSYWIKSSSFPVSLKVEPEVASSLVGEVGSIFPSNSSPQ